MVCGERARSGATFDVVAVSADATDDRDGPFVLCVAADASDIRGFRDAASDSDWDGDLASPPLDLFSAGYLILPDFASRQPDHGKIGGLTHQYPTRVSSSDPPTRAAQTPHSILRRARARTFRTRIVRVHCDRMVRGPCWRT